MKKAERAHLSQIAEQGCVLCLHLGYGRTPAEIHHLRSGMGMGQRNNNMNVIPLCPEHHRGNTGFHGLGRRAFERKYGVTELDLLEMSNEHQMAMAKQIKELKTPGAQKHQAHLLCESLKRGIAARTIHPEQKECPTPVAADSGAAHTEKEY